MKPAQIESLQRSLRRLEAELPSPIEYSTSLRKGPLKGDHAGYVDVSRDPWSAALVVDVSQTFECALDTLIHEWAHLAAFSPARETEQFNDHGPEWGVAYARAYCIVHREHFS
jgi:hypothetical protein